MRKLTKQEYVLSAIFALVAAFPLATGSSGWSFDVQPLASVSGDRVDIRSREEHLKQRRAISTLREACERRAGTEEHMDCPDINNRMDVRQFLQGRPSRVRIDRVDKETQEDAEEQDMEEEETLPPEEEDVPAEDDELTVSDLDNLQRAMLRRFQRAERCPHGLDDFLPGFQVLCDTLIKSGQGSMRGFLNHRMRMHMERQAPAPTVNDMLDMFKGARPDR